MDYIAYHNPDKMGPRATQGVGLGIVTNHPGKCVPGDRVWLITGEGRPRKYYLRCYFTVSSVGHSNLRNFSSEVNGNDGRLYDPMPRLDTEPWFRELITKMKNFRGGFQPINIPKVILGLERVAGIAALAASRK